MESSGRKSYLLIPFRVKGTALSLSLSLSLSPLPPPPPYTPSTPSPLHFSPCLSLRPHVFPLQPTLCLNPLLPFAPPPPHSLRLTLSVLPLSFLLSPWYQHSGLSCCPTAIVITPFSLSSLSAFCTTLIVITPFLLSHTHTHARTHARTLYIYV